MVKSNTTASTGDITNMEGGDSFFAKLRMLGASIDRQVAQFENDFQEKDRDFCAPKAKMLLTELSRDVKELKKLGANKLDALKVETCSLDEILRLGGAFLKTQTEQHEQTEKELKQYGYTCFESKTDGKKVLKVVTEAMKMEPEDIPSTPPAEQTKPLSAVQKDLNRTPRLEDAGISQYTLQYLNSVSKGNRYVPGSNIPVSSNTVPDIPSSFLHNGIICTPGFMGNIDMSMCGDKLHASLASPVAPVLMTSTTNKPQLDDKLAMRQISGKLNFDMPCPDSPLFRTPGLKQMLSNTKVKTEHCDSTQNINSGISNKRPAHVSLFQSIKETETKSEPLVPSLSDRNIDDEPQEPEMTYNLEELTEMTGMFKFSQSQASMPAAPVSLAQRLVENKENATPPEPEMLSQRISKVTLDKQKQTAKEDFIPVVDDGMPRTPTLLGKYDFV